MREILFRGKRIDNGEWVEGCLVNNLWIHSKDSSPIYEIITGAGNNSDWDGIGEDENCTVKVNPESVSQFTGLHDKHKKQIFEGDILKLDETPDILKGTEFQYSDDISHHIIYWDDKTARFFDTRLEDGDSLTAELDGDLSFVSDCIIIGNIHDNPELLTSK